MERTVENVSIGFVSTYPPTVCGLATYTESLLGAISGDRGGGSSLGVVEVGGLHGRLDRRRVVHRHFGGDSRSLGRAARILNTYDTVSVQHEFGIFSGPDGVEVLDLVEAITVPVAVTLHTVLDAPTPGQRAIMGHLADRADQLVVMSNTAAARLAGRYGVDPDRIEVIPHGANPLFARPSLVAGGRPLVLTWGLIGPGKGLETAIRAFAGLLDLRPAPRYLIAGATHPNVVAAAGETYRQSLVSLAQGLGLDHLVEFDDRYLGGPALARLVRRADMVLLPYSSTEQVTSGVLAEAIAAGKPVVATPFPHAVELLTGGAGLMASHGDVAGFSGAIRSVLTDQDLRSSMGRDARRLAESWFWPMIGRRYSNLLSRLAGRSTDAAGVPSGEGARYVAG
ncbi:MAG: glycosyltransferase [Acidimicrobiia bacterium]|nr:glycosyltransferase [Acidimicrobiia bacterium]